MVKKLMLVQMSKMRAQKQVKKRIVLVTGATSGMGRMLVDKLLEKNSEVRVILRKHPSEHVEWRELPKGVKIYVADVRINDEPTRNTLLEACGNVSVVYHLAAATRNYSTRYSNEKIDTNLMINTNVIGTENLIQAYADANPAKSLRLIYASSISVYGYKRTGETLTEESYPKPGTAYGESKYMAEQVINAFAAANKRLTYTILRIGVMYGPGYGRSFMRVFRMLKEKRLRIVGSGNNHLSLVNVADVVNVMLKVIETLKSANKTYNVTDGVPYTQKELFKKAAQLLNVEPPSKSIHPILARLGARTRGMDIEEFSFIVSDRIISIDKAKRELGFKPTNSDIEFRVMARKFLSNYNK